MRQVQLRSILVAIIIAAITATGCGITLGVSFRLVSPANGSAVSVAQPRFVWTSASNATGYSLVVRNAAGTEHWQTTTTSDVTEATYDGPGLANGETYRWRVTANFPAPFSPQATAEWSFTKVPTGPMEPILVSPPNGSSVTSATPLFNWQAPAGGTPTAYKVEVRDPGGILVWNIETPGTTTSATYSGPALLNGTTYRWKVAAVHTPPNPPTYSAEWSFTKVPIEAPLLVSPPNGGTIGRDCTFVFSWTAVAAVVDTERYVIEVRRMPGDVLVWSTTVLPPATSIAAPPVVSGVTGAYRWRVAAVAKGDATPSWSNFWEFTITAVGPCPSPTPTPTPTPTPAFAVTGVVAVVSPPEGTCAPTTFTFQGLITTNGAGTVIYRWVQGDGFATALLSLTAPAAGTHLTPSHTWIVAAPPLLAQRWARVEVQIPNAINSNNATFTCP